MEQSRQIVLTAEDGTKISFDVLAQTMITGTNFLLVTGEDENQEEQAYIMREVRDENDEFIYEFVEDDHELSAISKVFEEILDDVDIEM